MNIMKTNMLNLNSKRLIKDNGSDKPSTVVTSPLSPEQTPAESMKAVSFKKGAKALAALTMATAMVPTLVSCEKGMFEGDTTIQVAKMDWNFEAFADFLTELVRQGGATQAYQLMMTQKMQELIDAVKAGNKTQDDFYNTMLQWIQDDATFKQSVLSGLETANGHLEQIEAFGQYFDDVEEYLDWIYNAVDSGFISAEQAWNDIRTKLGNIDSKLATVISNQEKAQGTRDSLKTIAQNILTGVGNIDENTAAMRAQNDTLIAQNRVIINQNNALKQSVEQGVSSIQSGMRTGFESVCRAIGWETTTLQQYLMGLGYTLAQVQRMTAGQIIAAVNHNTEVLSETNNKLDSINNDMNANAEAELEVLNEINANLKQAIIDFNKYAEADSIAQSKLLEEARKGNKSLDKLKNYARTSIANQEKEYAMFIAMNNNIKKLDKDLIQSKDQLAMQLGISVAQLNQTMLYLGWSNEQVQKANAQEIIAAIENNTNAVKANGEKINANGEKLQVLVDTVDDAEAFATQVIDLLGQAVAGINELNSQFAAFRTQYDKDMSALKRTCNNIDMNGRVTNSLMSGLNVQMAAVRNDIREGNKILRDVKIAIQNGDLVDLSGVESILNSVNANITDSKDQVLAKLDKGIEQRDAILAELEAQGKDVNEIKIFLQNQTSDNAPVINAIKTYGDKIEAAINNASDANLDALKDIGDKIDSLKALVKSFKDNFDTEAAAFKKDRATLNAKLDQFQGYMDNFDSRLSTIIVQNATAENTRVRIENAIKALQDDVKALGNIKGGAITWQEMDSLMNAYNNYPELKQILLDIKNKPNSGYDFTNMETTLESLYTGFNTYQADALKWLKEIAENTRGLDKTSEDYEAVLAQILEAVKNFKCECVCQCDHSADEVIKDKVNSLIP